MFLLSLSPLLVLLSLLASPSSCATFSTSKETTSSTFDLANSACYSSFPKPALGTTFSDTIDFSYPSINSAVDFLYLSGSFPVSLQISFSTLNADGVGCFDVPLNMTFVSSEELDNFIYEAAYMPGSCFRLQGPSIRCLTSFCALEETDIKFRANMTSLAQESLFKSDESIPLPGPKMVLQVGDDEVGQEEESHQVRQFFTFESTTKNGEFTLSLSDSSDSINDYFSVMSVNGEDVSLIDVNGSQYSVQVDEGSLDYFSLLESNISAQVEGTVYFKVEKNDDDDNSALKWILIGTGVALASALITMAIVLFQKKRTTNYEEVA